MTPAGRGAEPSSNEEGSAGLARLIRAGDPSAIQEFRSRFQRGAEFLLRRKLDKPDVSSEASAALDRAIRALQLSQAAETPNLPRLIRSIIQSQFGSQAPTRLPREDDIAERRARSVIAGMSPMEQRIVQRYFVHGDSPEAVAQRLRLNSQAVKDTLLKARSKFSHKARGSP